MQSPPIDHYRTLGLDRGCARAQIDAAYRLLAKRHHPDLNAGSAKAAKLTRALNEAHEVLSDPLRRRAYDRELHAREEEARPARTGRIERNISQDVNLRVEDFLRGTSLEVQVRDPGNPSGTETYPVLVPPELHPGRVCEFEEPRLSKAGSSSSAFALSRSPLQGARLRFEM